MVKLSRTQEPDPAQAEVYQAKYDRYQRVHAARCCMLSKVNEQCVDDGKLPLGFLGPFPVQFIEQKRQLLGQRVRYSL